MSEPRDPLDETVRAFREAPAPVPVRDLADEDEATRRVVSWLAAALAAQAPEAVATPAALLARRSRPPVLRLARRPALAAAALLLLLLGAAVWLGVREAPRAEAPVADAPRAGPPVAQQPAPDPVPGPTAPSGSTTLSPAARPVVAVADDHLELRSGPVRLLLFLPDVTVPDEVPR